MNRISSSSEDSLFVALFLKEPGFEHFQYFVNYLHYPEKGYAGVETKGYWTVGDQDELPERLHGSRVMLYAAENDKEYDNVYSAYNSVSENYKLGFALGEEFVKLTTSELEFSEMLVERSNLELIEIINPDKALIN